MADIVVKKRPTAALGFIFVTIFIDVLGLGIIIPILPKLLEQLGHTDISTAGLYSGYLTFTYALMQFLFSPVLGNLSDRYGRRPILLGSLFGFGLDYLLMAFAPSLAWLFVGRTIAGIAGASTTTATAYIADVSTGDNRAANFGLVGAASGLGFILGIGLGGYLGALGIRIPFMVAGGLAFLNAAYGYFVLPESLSKRNRRAFSWKSANPISSLIKLIRYPVITGLIGAFALVYVAQKAVESVLAFFVIAKFDWTLPSISSLGIFIGVLLVSIQAGLIRLIIPKFGLEKTIVSGLLFYAIGLALIAFAGYGWMMYVFMIPYCLGGISGPALQGLITEKVAANEQGELQGALTSLSSVTTVVGPLLMTAVFHHFTMNNAPVHFPGAPFFLGSLLMLIATFISIGNFRNQRRLNAPKVTPDQIPPLI
ncbi:TCR/Tet family MFS transporter [Mucilaginibacter ginkgonis]|uniref:TCR/Tet family MFS transporter n=1 Tax=Mucilaginibacter ginkgonis TaxID=2682091 RepID=A0A6I4HW79_9SPHI|nr:TCR/Tet family MFS transporter [Mucilaginibacter ginkgonis]QQL50953.1 TCR/Tet family MFS transporter [Mucilaginibacter ginkgonis]